MKHCLLLLFVGILVGITITFSRSNPDTLQKTINHPDTHLDVSGRLKIQTSSFNPNTRTVQIKLLQDNFEKMAISYGIELSDDSGRQIALPTQKDPFLLYSSEQKFVNLSIPPALDDGHYILRMTTASIGGSSTEILEHSFFFESQDSMLTELSADAFYSHSLMNREYIASADTERGAP